MSGSCRGCGGGGGERGLCVLRVAGASIHAVVGLRIAGGAALFQRRILAHAIVQLFHILRFDSLHNGHIYYVDIVTNHCAFTLERGMFLIVSKQQFNRLKENFFHQILITLSTDEFETG